MEPPWVLFGGGALCGFHLLHRATRDLDLAWQGQEELAGLDDEAIDVLRSSGLEVERVVHGPAFSRLLVRDQGEQTVVDLVADPTDPIEGPDSRPLGDVQILVASPHALLVGKLCALLGRSEARDVLDADALSHSGGDLRRAIEDAPRKDGGFSPLTVAYLLQGLPRIVFEEAEVAPVDELVGARDRLVEALLEAGGPE